MAEQGFYGERCEDCGSFPDQYGACKCPEVEAQVNDWLSEQEEAMQREWEEEVISKMISDMEIADAYADAWQAQFDDPSPYSGDYSEM